jgi:hypothetical protein
MFYPKIQSPFKRNDKKEFISEWSLDVFKYLQDNLFHVYEKLDGMNIRVYWNGYTVSFAGKSDNTEFTTEQLTYLQQTFKPEHFNGLEPCYLFGELVGKDCHTNRYNLKDVRFFLFDLYRISTRSWQTDEFIKYMADKIGIKCIETVVTGRLNQIIKIIRYTSIDNVPDSDYFPLFQSEGVILRPTTSILLPNEDRVITKLKFNDKYHEDFNLF